MWELSATVDFREGRDKEVSPVNLAPTGPSDNLGAQGHRGIRELSHSSDQGGWGKTHSTASQKLSRT